MRLQVICALAFTFLTAVHANAGETRPNIIVILTDDQGWADLGCQGVRKDIRTPNIDALAAGGLRATNGYASAPQCVPSRAGLLTGRYQNRFGVEANGEKLDGFDQQQTIASRLKKAGYATGMTGKWHLGADAHVIDHGFDDVFCTQSSVGMNLRAWANFDLDGKTVPGAPLVRPNVYHLDANSSAACAFIQRHAQEPFFFYLAYRAPHVPLDAPAKYTARFPGVMPERRRLALAAMSAIDDGVGRIMQTLRDHKLEEKTLLFFMSDNGAPLKMVMEDTKPISENGWDGSMNTPMNGEKGMLTEGGMREPWLAYWKGTIPAGQTYAHPVISLDIAATALSLAGLPRDPSLDGVDLIPHFTGKKAEPPHEVLFWRWISQSAIRQGKWKLLVGGPRRYLFDLEADESEKKNLIAEHPDIAKQLQSRLEAWAGELQPPGINTKEMARVWDAHYDYFLDGKPPVDPTAKPAAPAGAADWVARAATAEVKDGVLHIVADPGDKKHPFLAFTKLSIPGPATVSLVVHPEKAGKVGIAWRLESQKDFVADQIVQQDVKPSADFQTLSIDLPATGTIVHLRLFVPDGICDLRQLAIKSTSGSARKVYEFKAK